MGRRYVWRPPLLCEKEVPLDASFTTLLFLRKRAPLELLDHGSRCSARRGSADHLRTSLSMNLLAGLTTSGSTSSGAMRLERSGQQQEQEHSSEDEDDAAAEAAAQIAVTTIEADLQGVFEQMQVCEEMLSSTQSEQKMPSAAMTKFNESINTVVKRNKVLNAFTRQHHEQEGSDAVLFDTVPSWIPFTRISGYRYRLVMDASASSDFDVLRGALP